MTAKIDTAVQSAAPRTLALGVGTPPAPPPPAAGAELEKAKRAELYEQRVARWKSIAEGGGTDAWVTAQLKAKGLSTEGMDPGRDKAKYKDAKKAEVTERGVLKKLAWEAFKSTHVTFLGPGIYWDEKGNPDKLDLDDRAGRLKQNGITVPIETPDDLAKLLGVSIPRLRWMCFHREVDTGTHYRRWLIPKRGGGERTITAPKRGLKTGQRRVLRDVIEKLPVHGAAHGFLAGRSIVTNAAVHSGAHTVVKVDVKDFFPTVSWRRVRGLLRKGGMSERVATLVALLVTEAPRDAVEFRGKTLWVASGPRALPQGAPTSPAITNALCLRLDRRLSGLARKMGFRYTRYADDLTFSWHPPAKAKPGVRLRPRVGGLLSTVRRVLSSEGFRMHPEKTTVMGPGSVQRVTGLVVNAPPRGVTGVVDARVPRDVRKRLRAAIHNRAKGAGAKDGETLAQLRGMAAFVYMTDARRGRALLDAVDALERASV